MEDEEKRLIDIKTVMLTLIAVIIIASVLRNPLLALSNDFLAWLFVVLGVIMGFGIVLYGD